MKKPVISVVLTTYNAEKFIVNTINNIKMQSFTDFEVIVVDDFSKDLTVNIINEEVAEDSRFKVLVNDLNMGPGYSRNQGLRKSIGDYIIFLDDDDLYEHNMLEIAYNKISREKSDIVIFRSNLFNYYSNEKKINSNSVNFLLLPKKSPFYINEIEKNYFNAFSWWTWDKLISRKIILNSNILFHWLPDKLKEIYEFGVQLFFFILLLSR